MPDLPFISIQQKNPRGEEHGSSLLERRLALQVIGVVSHGNEIRPSSIEEAEKLQRWLANYIEHWRACGFKDTDRLPDPEGW